MGNHFKLLTAVAVCAFIAGCGDKSEDIGSGAQAAPVLTAATLGEQTVRNAVEYLAAAPYSDADQTNGARQAQVCRACHSLDENGPNMIGPGLHGFFGTPAGSRGAFDYSPVLRNADFLWTPRALDAWLVQPGRFLPGNRMTFAGVSRSSNRNDLIAYLLQVTSTENKN